MRWLSHLQCLPKWERFGGDRGLNAAIANWFYVVSKENQQRLKGRGAWAGCELPIFVLGRGE